VAVTPRGSWDVPLPRLGVALSLAGEDGELEWFLTARPWSTAALASARHTCDLRPDGRIHLNLDAAHHGLGSASCGPPVPAWHTLAAGPASFTVGLAAGPPAET